MSGCVCEYNHPDVSLMCFTVLRSPPSPSFFKSAVYQRDSSQPLKVGVLIVCPNIECDKFRFVTVCSVSLYFPSFEINSRLLYMPTIIGLYF